MGDENNNNVNKLNTILGVEEDKSVGSKIKTFAKKVGMIPDEKVLNVKTRADFRKTNKELNAQLGKWRKASKFHQGNPLVNYFIGDKHKVKAIKKTFAEMERTAFKSNRKLRGRLSELFGENQDKLTGRFDYGDGEINDKKIGFKNNKQSQLEQENKLNKLYEEREELLKQQEKISLLPNEEKTMNAIMKAQDELTKLQKEREKIDSNKLTGVKGTKLVNDDTDLILTHNKELSKLAGGFYERTNGDERLFKTLEKDIMSTMKSDQAEFDKLTAELKSLGGRKGAQTKKLNALMSLYSENPTNEIASAISAQETKLQETQDKINLKSSQKEMASRHLDVDKRRKAQYDYYYENKDKPQDFAQDKNYKTVEFPSKFDARMLKLTTARKNMDTDIGKFSTTKQLQNVDSSIDRIMAKIQSLQDSLTNITSDKDLANVNTELEQKNKQINDSEKELGDTKKQAGELLNSFKQLKLEAREINKELQKLNTDVQVDPWNYEMQSSDLEKYNDEIQDIKDGVDSINRGWRKSNVFTRLWSRTLINIRSQISDMFNPFTKFREGFSSWLDRWDNLPWKNTFEVISYNLVTAFEPAFKWLATTFIKIMQVVNVFIERWTGVNLFDKSAWQLEKIKKGVGQLTASFDELHSSNDNPNQFNTIFDADAMAVSPLDAGLENSLGKFADNTKKVFDNVWGFVKKHPLASAGIALATWLFGPKLLKAGAKLLGKGLKKLLFGSSAKDAAEKGGSLLGGLFGKTLYTGMNGKAVTVGKLLGGIALTAGGTALAISSAADAGKNWEDMTNTQKAVKVGFVGIGSAAAGLGAVMLGATGPVGWAVAGAVALGSLVVGMSQTQNGIGSLKEETKEWEETQQNMNKALDIANQADQIYGDSLAELKRLEEQTGESGKELYDAVERGILTTDDMTYSQTLVYNAYKKTQKALEDQTAARKKANELVREEAKEHADVIFKNAKESGSYDELAKHINTCWENGTMTTEQARDEISRCMAGMSETARNELLGKLQPALQQGLDYEKYQSGWNEFGRFWETMWTNAVGVHDQSMANMKATEEDLLNTTDALKNAQEQLTQAENELSIAEKNAGMTIEELMTKIDNGEISVSNLTDAQRKLYEAHINVENSSAKVDIAMQKNGENLVGLAKQSYEASGDWKKYAETLIKANKDGQLSTEDMEREIGDSLGRLSGDERKYAEDWLKENNRMTNGVQQACNKQEGFFRNMLSNIGKWISQKTAEWGDWWADILPGGETSQSRQVKREIKNIQNNPYYSEEEKRRLINNLSATMPSYAVGTNYVPNDQLAMIHQGEAIIPKKYNKPYSPQSSSSELESTIFAMTQEIANLRNLVQQGIPVKGEFRQRGSDLVAVVEKGKNKNGNQMLSNPAYAR